MTAKQLRQLIKDIDDDTEVILSKDAEGNGYSPLAGYSAGVYVPASTWAGEFYWGDEAEGRGGRPAVCLWPTN